MTVDATDGMGSGHIYAVWGSSFVRSTDGGRSFHGRYSVPAFHGNVTVGLGSTVYVVEEPFKVNGETLVSRSRNARNASQTPTFEPLQNVNLGGPAGGFRGPNPGGGLGMPWIEVDRSDGERRGFLYVLCSANPAGPDPLDVMFARSEDDGKSWIGPIRVNDDPTDTPAWQWFGMMSVSRQTGRIDAAWNDTRNSQQIHLSELYYAYSTDGGDTWSKNVPIAPMFDSHVGWPRQNKIGDYYHMVSDELGPKIAYAATFNGEQDVYYLRLAIDCNDNGIHDGDDIASGTSEDANDNGVPDECEPSDCDVIRKFTARCVGEKLIAKIKSDLPEGTVLTIDNNGDLTSVTLDERGRAKTKWRGQVGQHRVTLVECPRFSIIEDCGG